MLTRFTTVDRIPGTPHRQASSRTCVTICKAGIKRDGRAVTRYCAAPAIRLLVVAVLAILFEILIAYLVIGFGALPANTDAQPSKPESWIARTSLHAAIRREAPKGEKPTTPRAQRSRRDTVAVFAHKPEGTRVRPRPIGLGLWPKPERGSPGWFQELGTTL
jgi:hypothetical protein